MKLSKEKLLAFFVTSIMLLTNPGHCLENGDDHTSYCSLQLKKASIPEEVDKFIESNMQIIKYNFNVDKDKGPFSPNSTEQHDLLKPYSLVLALDPVGKSLLHLKENFIPMSLYTLEYGVAKIAIDLIQSPPDCLRDMHATDLEKELKLMVFRNFGNITSSAISEGEICNQHVHATEDGTGIVKYACCKFAVGDNLVCLDLGETVWINVLFTTIIIVEVVLVLYSPTFIPISSKRDKYKEYIYKPTGHMELKVLKLKNKININEIDKDFVKGNVSKGLREELSSLPKLPSGEDRKVYPLAVRKVKFDVKAKKLLPGSPIAFVNFLKTFFLQLKMRKDLPELNPCCRRNIFNMFGCKFMQSYPWYKCLIPFMWLLAMVVCVSPWLFRVWFFYAIEEEDRDMLINVLNNKGLRLPRPCPGSLVVFLTPAHALFLLTYVTFAVFALLYHSCNIKTTLKPTIWVSLKRVQQTKFGSCRTFIAIMLFPLETCGIIGIVFLPFWLVILSAGLIILWVRILPLVNLTIRLLLNVLYTICVSFGTNAGNAGQQKKGSKGWEILSGGFSAIFDKEDISIKAKKSYLVIAKNKLIDLGKLVREILSSGVKSMIVEEDISDQGQRIIFGISKTLMCICLFLFYVLVIECISFYVDVVVYVIIGIILNSKFVMKFLALAVIIALHTYDCFSSVGKAYEGFAKAVNSEIQKKLGEGLENVAKQSEKIQQRQAFAVPPLNDGKTKEIVTLFDDMIWKPNRLVLFLDKDDTPYLPSKFFYSTVNMGHSFCPKPVYRMYLMALIEFIWIMLFLGFVMLVVLAFGGAHNISETNQTLATLASGLVPFAFRQLFKPRSASKVDKDDLGWRTKLAQKIDDHSSFWTVKDLDFVKDLGFDKTDQKVDLQDDNVQIIIEDGNNEQIWIRKSPIKKKESETRSHKIRSRKVGCSDCAV